MARKLSELLVVSDVDGTLLQAGYGIPKENLEGVERFVNNGGRFTVATGRSVDSVRRYVDWIPLSAPAILCNGALIYDYRTDKVLFNKTLDPRARSIVVEIRKVFPELGVEVHSVDGITAVAMNEYVLNHTAVEHIPFVLGELDTIPDGWNKVLFADEESRIGQVEKYVLKKKQTSDLYNEFTFVKTSPIYYELIPNDINKGEGLRKLAELLGVPMENTVAVGDYDNDLPLLAAAGYSAAVADAPAHVRADVDVTVKSCLQGGVGELLDSLESYCQGYVQLKLDL